MTDDAHTIQLLIVDDEVTDRALYQRILSRYLTIPHNVFEAENAAEAIQCIQKNKIDCVLLDYQLPDKNGLDLLVEIKRMVGQYVPIIMLTGKGDESVAVSAMKQGATDYIVKSKIESLELVKIIKHAICNVRLKKIILKQQDKIKQFSYYDKLTNLLNRHTFEKTAEDAFADAKRFNHALAILFIDIDDFIMINDSFGYAIGNELLIEVANRLTYILPNDTIAARLGDDEFVVLLKGNNIEYDAANLAKCILQKLHEPFQLSIETMHVTASIGIAFYPGSSTTLSGLLKCANIALKRAKITGGVFKFHSENLNSIHQREVIFEKELHRAVDRSNEFMLLYQPVFQLPDRRLSGLEVTLCWNHPVSGVMPYDQFVSIADRSGLSSLIENWIFKQLQYDYYHNFDEQLKILPLTICINISPHQLKNYLLTDSIQNFLNKDHAPISKVSLSVNESTFIDYLHNSNILNNLSGLSIQLIIKEFTLGFQAIEKINSIPISSIKIDSNYIQTLDQNNIHEAMILSIIALGKHLHIKVIASGVETKEQFLFLSSHLCPEAQGNYFCKPLQIKELVDYLRKILV